MVDFTDKEKQILANMAAEMRASQVAALPTLKSKLVRAFKISSAAKFSAAQLKTFMDFEDPTTDMAQAGAVLLRGIEQWNDTVLALKAQIAAIENPSAVANNKPQPEEPTIIIEV